VCLRGKLPFLGLTVSGLVVRRIFEAKIKTDTIDSHTLARLLRVDLIPAAYIPGKERNLFLQRNDTTARFSFLKALVPDLSIVKH
jgi:hypothetical protein